MRIRPMMPTGRVTQLPSGDNIFEWRNSVEINQRHVARSRPITFRILTLACGILFGYTFPLLVGIVGMTCMISQIRVQNQRLRKPLQDGQDYNHQFQCRLSMRSAKRKASLLSLLITSDDTKYQRDLNLINFVVNCSAE
jgi:hypothetical protein